MAVLILGLLLFLGAHSARILAPGWRANVIARAGANRWKGIYSLTSIAGFVLIIWGFSQARHDPTVLYTPPLFLRHLNALFTLLAFILFTSAYVPRNHLKASIGHPMVAGAKTWALGHLLATGMLHDVVLFGAFLVWAIADFAISRRRDRLEGVRYPPGTLGGDILAVLIGVVLWAVFAFWLHLRWIGVSPFA